MPQVVAVAAAWVGTTVMTAVGTALTATGITAAVGGATALGIAHSVAMFAYTVSEIALWAGMSYAVDAATKPKLKPAGSEILFNMDPAYPREMIIGQRLVGGSMVARYSHGSNLYNAHMVIQVADHPCVELSKVYDGGRVVRSTPLTHGTRTEITAYSNSGGARVWMTWWDGRPGQTADTDLITKSALDPDVQAGKLPGWSSDHVGAGCAYIHVEVQWDSDILTSIPQFSWLVKGARLYDRRLDTTAGGSGSHRLDDPSTWEYTDNAAVAADHFLLGYKVEDDDLAFGIGLHPSEVPYEIFANAADLADEDVETGTGDAVETIKRYVINGVVSSADYFEDVLEAFQIQMAGRFVDLGGRIGFLGAEEREISIDLTDQHLTADDQMQFSDKLSFDDLYGAVSGTFADPANLYQQTPYETQTTPYNALPDGGEAQQLQMSLPYEIHPRRAVRNVKAWLNRESLQPRLVAVFMAVAWRLEPGDWFTFSSERLQLDMAKFEVIDIAKNDDFTVLITARAIDPEFLAFSVDNDPDLSVPPEVEPVDLVLDTPAFTPTATTISGGGATEPVIQVVTTAPNPVTRELVIEAQEWNGSALTGPVLFFVGHADNLTSILRQGLKPATSYKVRMKARAGARESAWSEWSTAITMSSTYVVPLAGGATGDLSDVLDDIDAEIAAADARLDSAEDTLDLHGTDIGTLETVTASQATLITGLQSKTTINANLLPNSTGAGGLEGWVNPGDWQVYDHPLWGPWLNRTFTGESTFTEYFYNNDLIDVFATSQYTVSFSPFLAGLDGGSVTFYVVYYDSGGGYVGEGGNLVLTADSTSGVRYSANFTTGATTAKVRFAVAMVNAVGDATYAHVGFWQAKIERGATATVWSDDGTLQEARARITTVESVNSDQDSAIATLDSRLDAAETDIDDVTGDVTTLTAANLISRMTAVDGGSASAQTLSAVKAELEGDIAGEASTRSAAVTSLESADADHDSAIATLDSRLDAAETDVDGLESTASNHTTRLAAIDGGSSSATSIAQLVAKTTPRRNLILNSTGLRGTAGWTATGELVGLFGASAYPESTGPRFYLYPLANLSDVDGTVLGDMFAVDSPTGDWFTLSGFCHFPGYVSGTAHIGVEWYNSAQDTWLGWITQAATVNGAFSVSGQLPAGAAYGRPFIFLENVATDSGYAELYWYRVKFEGGQAASLWTDDAEQVSAAARITEVESVASDNESAIAVIDSRMDAAETDIDGVQSSASNLSTRMTAVDGGSALAQTQTALKAELVAKTNPGQNLMPYPSGLGDNALASTIGWNVFSAPTPSQALYMPFYSPAGGAFYYIVWASGYNSAGAAYIVYEFPNAVVPGQVLTISLAGNTNLSGVTYSLGARNSSHSDLGFSSAVAVQLTRNSVSYTMPTGAAYATLVIQINAQNSAGAYRELYFRDIKLELGSVATVFTDDYGAGNVRARVTETEEAIADEVSARAAFQTTAEADIGSLESSVTTQGSAIADIEGNLSASYALTLDVNGRVTGVRFLNDGTTGSIKFLADYFSIYNGSSDVPMFEVTGGAAYIAGSRVRTESMTSNAVSQGVVEENDTAQSVDENWTALADVSVTVPSSATLVKLDWSFFIAESGEAEDDLLVRIKRDSTVIYETTAARVPPTFDFETTETGPLSWQGYAVGQFSGFDTDAPSAGTYTYTLEAKCAYSTTTAWSLEKRRLFALLFKR